jgi:hypothetical protein
MSDELHKAVAYEDCDSYELFSPADRYYFSVLLNLSCWISSLQTRVHIQSSQAHRYRWRHVPGLVALAVLTFIFNHLHWASQFDDEWKPYADTVLAMWIFCFCRNFSIACWSLPGTKIWLLFREAPPQSKYKLCRPFMKSPKSMAFQCFLAELSLRTGNATSFFRVVLRSTVHLTWFKALSTPSSIRSSGRSRFGTTLGCPYCELCCLSSDQTLRYPRYIIYFQPAAGSKRCSNKRMLHASHQLLTQCPTTS